MSAEPGVSDRQLTCEEALGFLAAFLDGELQAQDSADVERHLSRCRSCWSRAEFERLLKERLGELRQEPVPGTLQQRVAALLGGMTPQ